MTSFAFILGTMPMILGSGAGSSSRHVLGTGVVAHDQFVTLAVLFVPVFFVVVRRFFKGSERQRASTRMRRCRAADDAAAAAGDKGAQS